MISIASETKKGMKKKKLGKSYKKVGNIAGRVKTLKAKAENKEKNRKSLAMAKKLAEKKALNKSIKSEIKKAVKVIDKIPTLSQNKISLPKKTKKDSIKTLLKKPKTKVGGKLKVGATTKPMKIGTTSMAKYR